MAADFSPTTLRGLALHKLTMSERPGRNDPCYCGSGKKYKRCHLPIDEQAHVSTMVSARAKQADEPLCQGVDEQPEHQGTGSVADRPLEALSDWAEAAPACGNSPGALKQLAQAFKMASRTGLFKGDPELRRFFKDNETLLTYVAHEEEIHAALEKLKPYYAEFDRLCQDAPAYERQSKELFAEAAFAPFRFTAADLRRAFAEVGVPALDERSSRKTGKLVRKALLFLATKERRNELAMRLLLLLPGYVEQGRHLDACIIESCAQMTAEEPNEPNPFLGNMFLYGLEAWGTEQDASRKAVLKQAGLHVGPDPDPEEIERWLHKEMADPDSAARWQRLVEAHPELQVNTENTFQLMVRQAVDLLHREDADRLLLSAEEVQPWDAFLLEKLQAMMAEIGPLEPGVKASRAQSKKAFDQFYLPAVQEMTKGIFTPERIQRLVAELRAYRKELAAAGDKAAMMCATSAILYVEPEAEPQLNSFLVNLCARSMLNRGAAAEPEAGGAGGENQPTA
jgi:SEC-C motif-containing protein